MLQKSLAEAGTLNVISIGTGDGKFLDIEDVLPHSQVEKRIIDIKDEKDVGSTSQYANFPIGGDEKNLKAILQRAIKSKLGESDPTGLSLGIKREILDEHLNQGISRNTNPKLHGLISEGVGVASSSISRK